MHRKFVGHFVDEVLQVIRGRTVHQKRANVIVTYEKAMFSKIKFSEIKQSKG